MNYSIDGSCPKCVGQTACSCPKRVTNSEIGFPMAPPETPSEKSAKILEAGEGRKRLHKAVQNVLYNEVGVTKEVFEAKMEAIIEARVDHWLATHNMDQLLLNYIAKAIKEDKYAERYHRWDVKTLKHIVEEKVNSVVRELVAKALKGMSIKLD